MWLTLFGSGVRGEGGVESAAGMADEDVAGLQRGDDRIPAVGERRLLVDQGAVARQVDGDAVMAEPLQLGDRVVPAPRGVKTAVHEDESHLALRHSSRMEMACRGHWRTASRICSSFSGVTSSCRTCR